MFKILKLSLPARLLAPAHFFFGRQVCPDVQLITSHRVGVSVYHHYCDANLVQVHIL